MRTKWTTSVLAVSALAILALGCSSILPSSELPDPEDDTGALFIYIDHSTVSRGGTFAYYRFFASGSSKPFVVDPELDYGLYADTTLGARAIQTVEAAYNRSGKTGTDHISHVDFTLKQKTVTILSQKFKVSLRPGPDGTMWQYFSFSSMTPGDYQKAVAIINSLPGVEGWKIDVPLSADFIRLARSGTPEQISQALSNGMAIDSETGEGSTPLMFAAGDNENPGAIAVLLKAGADVAARDNRGRTALMLAAMGNHNPEVVAALLAAGSDVNAHDKDGWTVLMNAARYQQNAEVLQTLLKSGADLNARRPDDTGVLMLAAAYNANPDVLTALLKAGADAKAKDSGGKTALDYAQENDNLAGTEALRLLESSLQ